MTIDYATMISDDIDNNELSDCMLSVMSTSGFQTYQKQIQECDVYRKLIRLSSEVITQSYDQKDIINILNLLRNQNFLLKVNRIFLLDFFLQSTVYEYRGYASIYLCKFFLLRNEFLYQYFVDKGNEP